MGEGKKISYEKAVEEIESWLDHKKISEKKREDFKQNIANMVEAMQDGCLVLDEDFNFIQTLKFSIGDVKEFAYKPRIKVKDVESRLQNIKVKTSFSTVYAYISALTNQPAAIVSELETDDYVLADNIAVFFMV